MNERTLFLEALEIDDPVARSSYLDQACAADVDLRRRVEALLIANAQPSSFLDKPAVEDLFSVLPESSLTRPDPNPAAEIVGATIGDKYLLRRMLGSGGMGTVYLAEQSRPVRRDVAVKLINPGMDSRQVLSRFEAERQALAVMDHPNIAKVFDGGSTEVGRPFFVMEFVKGIPLTDFCDAHHLSVHERLRIFRKVCAAVHHAHQKGIIHRDLKPTNILVEMQAGEPVPKIIDFGLAKAIGGLTLTDQPNMTALGSFAGTPLYMAPEQASFHPQDIDTRADVFSLGVISVRALDRKRTPLRSETLVRTAVDELFRQIREQEPPPPSSRLSTLDVLPSIAANRRIEPNRLGSLVHGELDWIVLKALAKDRALRYDSASSFAADLARYLNHEPVEAGPPSRIYKIRKFARRNRLALGVAGRISPGVPGRNRRNCLGTGEARRERATAIHASELSEKSRQRAYHALETLTDGALEDLLSRQANWGKTRTRILAVHPRSISRSGQSRGERC